MSELRDLTSALASFSGSMSAIEECLVVLLRNSAQESDWRHQQQNLAQQEAFREGLRDKAFDQLEKGLKQLGEFQGALWKYLGDLDERQTQLANTRHEDVKELKARVHKLEGKFPSDRPEDEVTQA